MTTAKTILQRQHAGMPIPSIRRSAVSIGLALSLLGLALLIYCGVQHSTPAGPLSEDFERELALETFDDAVAINEARLQDPERVKQDAMAVFSILNPELVLRERLKDPAQVKADLEVLMPMLNPRQAVAKLQEDPEFRRQQEEAFRALLETANY